MTVPTDMNRTVKNALGTLLILFLVLFIFGSFCPIERIFGIPCPGCNMFTALYWLLKKDVNAAWFFHPVVFLLLPYLVICVLLYVRDKERFTENRAFRIMSAVLIAVMIGVYIWRMINVFPKYPMQLEEEAPVIRLLNTLR